MTVGNDKTFVTPDLPYTDTPPPEPPVASTASSSAILAHAVPNTEDAGTAAAGEHPLQHLWPELKALEIDLGLARWKRATQILVGGA